MFYFINYLRAIATVLITNSHYSNIWPSSSLAVGGLLGNVLFFAASGFCLFNIKENFGQWYIKRALRVLPVMLLFTLFTVLIGQYSLNSGADAVRLFLFPTNYIFLVWLLILYVPFYFVAKFSKKWEKCIEIGGGVLLIVWITVYLLFVDKSVYHIDDVSKPFILFLYFSSMLLGGLFRKYQDAYKQLKWWNVVLLFVSLVVYFGTKILFSKMESVAFLQIINQLSILAALYFVFAVFIGLEEKLAKIPAWINETVKFISNVTLQIYIVQFVIIRALENLAFPLNFLATTAAILAAASLVYLVEYFIRKGIGKLTKKGKESEKNDAKSSN